MESANITLDIYNILIDIIILLAIFTSGINKRNTRDMGRMRKWFQTIVFINLAMSGVDIFIQLFDGKSRPANVIILPAAAFLYYCAAFLLLYSSAKCISALLDQVRRPKKGRKFFSGLLIFSAAAYSVLLISTPFTGLLYRINEDNFYSRGDFIFLALAVQMLMYAGLFVYLLVNIKTIHPFKIIIMAAFIFFPQTAQIIQILFPGFSLVNTGYSLVFIIMFIFSNSFAEGRLKNAEDEIQDKSTEIEKNRLQIIKMQKHTIKTLSNLVENRNVGSGDHLGRIKEYVEILAAQLREAGYCKDVLTPDYVKLLKMAVPVYDIGKIVVPDDILKKQGPLTPEEDEQLKRHAREGGKIVHEILDGYESHEYIKIASDIATYHHERWDGLGYPDNLSGEKIPLGARIMAIIDSFDSMVAPKNDKARMAYDEAFEAIENGIGVNFDPTIAREFLKIKHKAMEINERHKENASAKNKFFFRPFSS